MPGKSSKSLFSNKCRTLRITQCNDIKTQKYLLCLPLGHKHTHTYIYILSTYLQPTYSIHQSSRSFSKAIMIHGSKYKYLLAYIICLGDEN